METILIVLYWYFFCSVAEAGDIRGGGANAAAE